MTDTSSTTFCTYCGAQSARRIGLCGVCGRSVCEKCGNTQHIKGERRITHDECLRKDDSGFSMIKFVK